MQENGKKNRASGERRIEVSKQAVLASSNTCSWSSSRAASTGRFVLCPVYPSVARLSFVRIVAWRSVQSCLVPAYGPGQLRRRWPTTQTKSMHGGRREPAVKTTCHLSTARPNPIHHPCWLSAAVLSLHPAISFTRDRSFPPSRRQLSRRKRSSPVTGGLSTPTESGGGESCRRKRRPRSARFARTLPQATRRGGGRGRGRERGWRVLVMAPMGMGVGGYRSTSDSTRRRARERPRGRWRITILKRRPSGSVRSRFVIA